MSAIDKLYKKGNYLIQKSINFEDKPYTALKEIIEKDFEATTSDVINACIEDLISNGNIKYYSKPAGEILCYSSVMLRKDNILAMNKITEETGISLTKLVNISIKEFLNNYEKQNGNK